MATSRAAASVSCARGCATSRGSSGCARRCARAGWRARTAPTATPTSSAAGGLAAVEFCDGLAPSYGLAVFLDRWMFLLACEHVLAWPDEPLPAATRERHPGALITAQCPRCERAHAGDRVRP